METDTGIVQRKSIIYYVATYQKCVETINRTFAELAECEKQFKELYQYAYFKPRYNNLDFNEPERIISKLKTDFWRGMIEKMEIKRFMSANEIKKLEKSLDNENDLPEITEENIFQMIQSGIQNMDSMIQELIKSVFDYLRPCRWDDKKTNKKFCQEIGLKVIKHYVIGKSYGKNKYSVNYHSQDTIRDIERAFMVLDGKGAVTKSYYGDLIDAIQASETGNGETEYFIFKCFNNGNLHLTFKRADLVQKMNAMIGKNILKTTNPPD